MATAVAEPDDLVAISQSFIPSSVLHGLAGRAGESMR